MLHPKYKSPLMLVLLLLFVALLGLTIWTSESDLNGLVSGVPRTLEFPKGTHVPTGRRGERDAETGIPLYKRNLRIAGSVIIIIGVALVALVFVTPKIKPSARSGANFALAFILVVGFALLLVTAALDTNSEHDAIRCSTDFRQSQSCESLEDLYTAVVVFEWITLALLLMAILLLIAYTRQGDWVKAHDAKLLAYGETGALQPGMYPNGMSFVRKWVLSLLLLAVFVFAALVLLGTIMLHEYRAIHIPRNANGEARDANGDSTRPGWPTKNTIVRYFLCGGAILVLLANLIPIRSMTLHYVFSFLYVILAILAIVAFILDVKAINDSDDIPCPQQFSCKHHRFNAIAALDFFAALLLLILVCVKCAGHKKKKAPVAAVAETPATQIVHVPVPVPVAAPQPVAQTSFVQQPVIPTFAADPFQQPAVLV